MKAHIYDPESLRAITPASVAAYISAQGWDRVEKYGEHSDVFALSGQGEIIVPGVSDLGDYPSVISAIIERLAEVEVRDELQIYGDLAVADTDVIRVRSPHADDDGSIGVDAGVDLITQARDLLLSAACSAHDARAMYRAGKNKEASAFMDGVRLGQTERGSYVVTLLTPVPLALEDSPQQAFWPAMAEEPYERRVTRVLANALTEARQAVESAVRGEGLSAFRRAIPRGVSANLCEALAGLIESTGDADISITWALTRPAPEKRRAIRFAKDQGPVLREAARLFRSAEPKIDENFEAFVVKLDRGEEEPEGRVTLRSIVDGQILSVRAELPENLYVIAVTAHRERSSVLVNGDLVKRGSRWWLDKPRALVLADLEQEDDEQQTT